MAGPFAARQIPAANAFKALSIVYIANFVGAAVLAGIVATGAVGSAALDLAATKAEKGFVTTMASGFLADLLVCLAVWLAYAAQTTIVSLGSVAANLFPATIGNVFGGACPSPPRCPRQDGGCLNRFQRAEVGADIRAAPIYQFNRRRFSWRTRLQIRSRKVLLVAGAL